MIQCKRCHLQYIGDTRRCLKKRFDEFRRPIKNPSAKYTHSAVVKHFLSSPNHTADDMQLIPMEKISSNLDSDRGARKAILIQKGKTIHPNGLNIRK